MGIYKPDIAKIISIPAILVALLVTTGYFIASFIPGFSINDFNLLFLGYIIISYILSCIIWSIGENHKRILIVIFTMLSVLASYLFFTVIIGLVEFCPQSLGLPCMQDGTLPCQRPPSPPCPEHPVLRFLSYGLPVVILVTGIILFIRERKYKAGKGKK